MRSGTGVRQSGGRVSGETKHEAPDNAGERRVEVPTGTTVNAAVVGRRVLRQKFARRGTQALYAFTSVLVENTPRASASLLWGVAGGGVGKKMGQDDDSNSSMIFT